MSDSRYPGKPAHRPHQHLSSFDYQHSPQLPNTLGIFSTPASPQPPYPPSQYSSRQSASSPSTYRPGSVLSGSASHRTRSRTPTTITYPDSDDEAQTQLSSLHIPSPRSLSQSGPVAVAGSVARPPAHGQSTWASSPYIKASLVTRQLDHVHDYFEDDMPKYANTQMSVSGISSWVPGQATYDDNDLRVYRTGDYVYVRRRKNKVRPTEPAEWSNWVCGRVVAAHMCGHSKDCERIFNIRASYCYIVRYDRAPEISRMVLEPSRYGVAVFSSAGEMRMGEGPHDPDEVHRFRRSCSMKKNWQYSDDPVIGGRPGLVFMQDTEGTWHPGLCYKKKLPTTPGGTTLYLVRTIGKSDGGTSALSRSHLLPYSIETVLVLRHWGRTVHTDGLPEFREIR